MTDQAMNDTTTPAPITRIEPRNGYGLTSVILGAVGAGLGLIPLLWFLAGPAGIAGLALALANRGRLKRQTATNKKTTIWGAVLSLAAIGLAAPSFLGRLTLVTGKGHEPRIRAVRQRRLGTIELLVCSRTATSFSRRIGTSGSTCAATLTPA